MNSHEHPFDKAADDAMFAEYMTPEFFDLPSEEIYLTDSGIASMALRLNESSTATIQVCLSAFRVSTPLIIIGPEYRT